MADQLSERVKVLLKASSDEDETTRSDTFAQRAEWYYHKRPQLLALLQDLYNGYTILLDRCHSMETKHHSRRLSSRHSSLSSLVLDSNSHCDQEEDSGLTEQIEWNEERDESYSFSVDEIVADLVVKNVEKDMLLHELMNKEKQTHESSRKIELLKKLLEVLESERVVLLKENMRMGEKMTAALEENRGLSSEVMFLKRKAAELARCVVKMREDHRVYMLTRKIEDLQGQIYGLERRNKEYYQQLLNTRDDDHQQGGKEDKNGEYQIGDGGVHQMSCFQLKKMNKKNESEINGDSVKSFGVKWWAKLKSMAICGLHQTSIAVVETDSDSTT